jgi:hypothetical protein
LRSGARNGISPDRQIRSLVLRVDLVGSRRIWTAQLDASSMASGRDGTRRIFWMIKRMLKAPGDARGPELYAEAGDPRWAVR